MSWIHVRLRDVCEIVSGATPKTSQSEFWDGGIPWVTPKDLSANPEKFIGKGSRSITEEGLASCSARLLPVGSVLFSSRAPIGLTGITSAPLVRIKGSKAWSDKSKLDSEYLYHWLNSNTKKFRGKGRGATFAELSKEMVSDFEIPYRLSQSNRGLPRFWIRRLKQRNVRKVNLRARQAAAIGVFGYVWRPGHQCKKMDRY